MTYLQTTIVNMAQTVEIKEVGEKRTWVLGNYSIFPHVAIFMYPESPHSYYRDELCEICPKNWWITV